MANRRVRIVRSVKINGKAVFCAPEITPKGSVSTEVVHYEGQKLKIPAAEGRWYIRWEEGSKPKWQRCDSMSDAITLQVRKRIELQAVAAGVEVKPDDPSRLRLADALQQYIDDQRLLKRSKKTLAAHRVTKETFLKSCHRAYLDQVDRRAAICRQPTQGRAVGAHGLHSLDSTDDNPEISWHPRADEAG